MTSYAATADENIVESECSCKKTGVWARIKEELPYWTCTRADLMRMSRESSESECE